MARNQNYQLFSSCFALTITVYMFLIQYVRGNIMQFYFGHRIAWPSICLDNYDNTHIYPNGLSTSLVFWLSLCKAYESVLHFWCKYHFLCYKCRIIELIANWYGKTKNKAICEQLFVTI